MFESTAEERMKVFRRRGGTVYARGTVTPEIMRRHMQPVCLKASLLAGFANPLDFGREVYCPACAGPSAGETIAAYPLIALQDKNPMADGDMVSFTCLHCGFVEHHRAPRVDGASMSGQYKAVVRADYEGAFANAIGDQSFQDFVRRHLYGSAS